MSTSTAIKVGSGQIAQLGERDSNAPPSVESVISEEQEVDFKVRDFPSLDEMEREINGKDEDFENSKAEHEQDNESETMIR